MKKITLSLMILVVVNLSSNLFGNNGYIDWITVYRTINGSIEQYNIDPSQTGVPEIYMDEGGYLKVLVWQGGGTPSYEYYVWGQNTGYLDIVTTASNSHTFYLSDNGQGEDFYSVAVDDDWFDFEIIEQSLSLDCVPLIEYIFVNNQNISFGNTVNISLDNLEDGFEIQLWATNIGEDNCPGGYNNLTLAFPQYTSESDKFLITPTAYGTGFSVDEYFGDEAQGGDQDADYVMVEGIDNDGWPSSGVNYITAIVQPKEWGEFVIEFRMGLGTDNSYDNFNYDPAGGYCSTCGVNQQLTDPTIDPIGFHCYYVTVNITSNIGTVQINSPNGGEVWEANTLQQISWEYSGNITAIDLQYTTDNGNSWQYIDSPPVGDQVYDWTLPEGVNSDDCKVKILGYYEGNAIYDLSYNTFTISTLSQNTLQFAGLNWNVKTGTGGPGPNNWSNSSNSVWVDNDGKLHMKIRKLGNEWYCSEVWTEESFGYGEYKFYTETVYENLDKNIVTGLFTYLTDNDEIDIEFSKWGSNLNNQVGNYVVQPGNLEMFDPNMTGDYSTHRFVWLPNNIQFQSWHGHYSQPGPLMHEWTYTGVNNPEPANEKLHLNFWLFQGNDPSNQQEAELIINNVEVNTDGFVEFFIYNPDLSYTANNAFISCYDIHENNYSGSTDENGYYTTTLPSENYYYDVYNQELANDERELWASSQFICSPIQDVSEQVERQYPYITGFIAKLENEFIEPGGQLEINTVYEMQATVHNNTEWTNAINTRCKLILDRDQSEPYDFDPIEIFNINSQTSNTFSFSFTPIESWNGSNMFIKIIIESELG